MNLEHGFAHGTIVAASGASVKSGLSGFHSGNRLHTQQEAVVLPPSSKNLGVSSALPFTHPKEALAEGNVLNQSQQNHAGVRPVPPRFRPYALTSVLDLHVCDDFPGDTRPVYNF